MKAENEALFYYHLAPLSQYRRKTHYTSKITASENVYLTLALRQTLWTQIRLLLQEQSDLGPHCLSMRLQIF